MLKLGIIGSDNSHAVAYSRLANIEGRVGDQARVTAICGADPDRTREVAGLGQIPAIASDPADLAAQVDAVIVVDRHGDLHREHALAAIAAGRPVYVDKPLAISLEDCVEIIGAARQAGVSLDSFSSMRVTPATIELADEMARLGTIRHGQFTGPCDFASEYGGPFFYATHTIEIALRVLGDDLLAVRATRAGTTVTVGLQWSGGVSATIDYLTGTSYHFHAVVIGDGGMTTRELVVDAEGYAAALQHIVATFEGSARPLAPAQVLTPIVAVHAIQESLASNGATVDVSGSIANLATVVTFRAGGCS